MRFSASRTRLGLLSAVLVLALTASASAASPLTQWFDLFVNVTSLASRQAAWETWALTSPVSTHPVLDTTGAQCAVGQSPKQTDVWFLAGVFGGGSVTRACTVPANRTIFFPIYNQFYAWTAPDPLWQNNDLYVRTKLTDVYKVTGAQYKVVNKANNKVVAQGTPIFPSDSIPFTITFPSADNVFGVPAGFKTGAAADRGFYVTLPKLAAGNYTITWKADGPSGSSQNVTYNITQL